MSTAPIPAEIRMAAPLLAARLGVIVAGLIDLLARHFQSRPGAVLLDPIQLCLTRLAEHLACLAAQTTQVPAPAPRGRAAPLRCAGRRPSRISVPPRHAKAAAASGQAAPMPRPTPFPARHPEPRRARPTAGPEPPPRPRRPPARSLLCAAYLLHIQNNEYPPSITNESPV